MKIHRLIPCPANHIASKKTTTEVKSMSIPRLTKERTTTRLSYILLILSHHCKIPCGHTHEHAHTHTPAVDARPPPKKTRRPGKTQSKKESWGATKTHVSGWSDFPVVQDKGIPGPRDRDIRLLFVCLCMSRSSSLLSLSGIDGDGGMER